MAEEKNKNLKSTQQSQPQPQRRSCFNFRNCCFSCLGVIVFFIILIVVLLSLSGLVQVPLLSRLLYGDGPKPSRLVTYQSFDMSYFENLFKTAAQNNQNQVIVTENELSYLVNELVNKENNVLVPEDQRTKGSQVAAENGYAEFFLKLRKPKTALTIEIIPEQNELKAKKFKIGKLRMPVFVPNFFFDRFLDMNSILQYSGIKTIKFERGKAVITIDPAAIKERPEREEPAP